MSTLGRLQAAWPAHHAPWWAAHAPTITRIVRAAELRERLGLAHAPDKPVVTGAVDFFKLNDAPYVIEERVAASGRTYEVKVYTPEAYTEAYMGRSTETNRLVRWGIYLSDGALVSRDGAFRLRFPEAWATVQARAAKYRGEKREEYLAEAFWKRLTPDEQEAMIASIDLDAYADARGAKQAEKDLRHDLRESKSPLGWAPVDWYNRVGDAYAQRYLGGPAGSDAWFSAPWSDFVQYSLDYGGYPIPPDVSPDALPLTIKQRVPDRVGVVIRLHPWIAGTSEYWRHVPRGERALEYDRVKAAILRRFGGPYDLDALWAMSENDAGWFIYKRLDPAWRAEGSLDAPWIRHLRAVVSTIQRGYANRPWSKP